MDFNAATEYDAVNNYKVLQAAFTKMGINKVSYLPLTIVTFMQSSLMQLIFWHVCLKLASLTFACMLLAACTFEPAGAELMCLQRILACLSSDEGRCCTQPVDVNKLVKGRPLDNMEFMQWLKFYFEGRLGCQDLDYDPVGRRLASDALPHVPAASFPAGVGIPNAAQRNSIFGTYCSVSDMLYAGGDVIRRHSPIWLHGCCHALQTYQSQLKSTCGDCTNVACRQQSKSGDVKGARTGPTSTVAVARSSATASQVLHRHSIVCE